MDQRNCIKFCIKNGFKCAKTCEMLTVTFGEPTMSRPQVQLWYIRFKEGREDVNDDARSGRPSMSITDEHIEAVKKMVLDNRRIREVAVNVGISFVRGFSEPQIRQFYLLTYPPNVKCASSLQKIFFEKLPHTACSSSTHFTRICDVVNGQLASVVA